ncbi:MAG TPA: M1 family metallopeptidase [Kofleriaceae bacterium]|nr:M1 family metallopeptidase [Kofleriaceae bacterium]
MKRLPPKDQTPALRGGGTAKSPRIASYKIEARLDASRHSLQATQTLIWTNAGQSAVDRLPFHLYMNAFKSESSLFMQSTHGEMRGAKSTDSGWGWISIESVQIAGTELANKLEYPLAAQGDETVAELPLVTAIEPGQTIEVAFRFSVQLPEVFARTGYKGDFHIVAQWFPKIGVRIGPPGAEQWECQPLQATTEFFADFGNYDVTLTVPNTEVVAATGVLVGAIDQPGQMRQYTYHAEDVHDFVWMADPYMEVHKGEAKLDDGKVEVRVYARKEQAMYAKRHLQAGIGAIEKFSAYFVPYPWPIMSIIDPPVDAWMGAGGMEYPTFVTTAGDTVLARPGLRLPEYVTVHEIGHNWFQGILASNEAEEAWLDEGINEWADSHVMRDLYGPRTSATDWMGWQAEVDSLRAAIADDPEGIPSPIASAAYAFVDTDAYGEATYTSTMRALATLENLVGSSKFMAAMKVYAKEFAFKHPTARDLYTVLQRELGEDLGWFFQPVFQQVGGSKLSVRSADCRQNHKVRGVEGDGPGRKTFTETERPDLGTFVCDVVVQNPGIIHIPVDVELRFADGSSQRVTWDDRGGSHWKRWTVERSSKLVEVRIDPDHKILLANPTTNAMRLEGDGSASLRASARIASWSQLLMQIVGP